MFNDNKVQIKINNDKSLFTKVKGAHNATKRDSVDNVLMTITEHKDVRGSLAFVQQSDWEFTRAFWIYKVPDGSERGGHAHRTCAELFIAVHGSLDLELYDGKYRRSYHLDNPSIGIIIRPMVWCRLYNFSKDFVGLCLASQEYIPEGYIYELNEFEKITKDIC